MTAPAPAAQTAAVASTYEAQQEQLRQQLLAALVAVWGLTSLVAPLPSPETLFNLVRRMVPPTLGAQRAMTALVNSELQRQVPVPGRPITVSPERTTGAVLRGVPVEQVYLRSFNEVRRQLDAGKSPDEAFAIGQRRLEKTALTDLQLAQTHTARDFATQLQQRAPETVVGFRRVLSSKPNHCALCILASTQRYHSFDLMPIHPGCGCGVAMIMGNRDPGKTIDDALVGNIHEIIKRDLGERYADPGGRQGLAHYRDILVTNTHGELGPVLGVRDQKFTGSDLVPRLGHSRVNPEVDDIPND